MASKNWVGLFLHTLYKETIVITDRKLKSKFAFFSLRTVKRGFVEKKKKKKKRECQLLFIRLELFCTEAEITQLSLLWLLKNYASDPFEKFYNFFCHVLV